MAARAASAAAIALIGHCVGVGVAVLLPFLISQSPPGLLDGAQAAAQLGPAAHMMLAGSPASSPPSPSSTYLHNGGGGGVAGAGDRRRIHEVTFLILCASAGFLDLPLCMQAGRSRPSSGPTTQGGRRSATPTHRRGDVLPSPDPDLRARARRRRCWERAVPGRRLRTS